MTDITDAGPPGLCPWLVICIASFSGGIVKGLTGFGSAIICVLFWVAARVLTLDPGPLTLTVVTDSVSTLLSAFPLLYLTQAHKMADWRLVTTVLITKTSLAPVGALMLVVLDKRIVQLAMAVMLLPMIALTTNIIKEGPELIRRLSTRMRSGRFARLLSARSSSAYDLEGQESCVLLTDCANRDTHDAPCLTHSRDTADDTRPAQSREADDAPWLTHNRHASEGTWPTPATEPHADWTHPPQRTALIASSSPPSPTACHAVAGAGSGPPAQTTQPDLDKGVGGEQGLESQGVYGLSEESAGVFARSAAARTHLGLGGMGVCAPAQAGASESRKGQSETVTATLVCTSAQPHSSVEIVTDTAFLSSIRAQPRGKSGSLGDRHKEGEAQSSHSPAACDDGSRVQGHRDERSGIGGDAETGIDMVSTLRIDTGRRQDHRGIGRDAETGIAGFVVSTEPSQGQTDTRHTGPKPEYSRDADQESVSDTERDDLSDTEQQALLQPSTNGTHTSTDKGVTWDREANHTATTCVTWDQHRPIG